MAPSRCAYSGLRMSIDHQRRTYDAYRFSGVTLSSTTVPLEASGAEVIVMLDLMGVYTKRRCLSDLSVTEWLAKHELIIAAAHPRPTKISLHFYSLGQSPADQLRMRSV